MLAVLMSVTHVVHSIHHPVPEQTVSHRKCQTPAT